MTKIKQEEELVKTELMSIDKIIPYKLNSKIHDEKNISKLMASISTSGLYNPILLDKNLVIIGGHGRLEAMKRLDKKFVEVRVMAHLNEQEVKVARIADNKTASTEYDSSKMILEMQEIDLTEIDAAILGFEAPELAQFTINYDQIDSSAFTQDLNGDVDVQTKEAENDIKKSDLKMVSVVNGLGFKVVTIDATRKIARFIAGLQEQYEVEDPAVAFLQFVDEMATA